MENLSRSQRLSIVVVSMVSLGILVSSGLLFGLVSQIPIGVMAIIDRVFNRAIRHWKTNVPQTSTGFRMSMRVLQALGAIYWWNLNWLDSIVQDREDAEDWCKDVMLKLCEKNGLRYEDYFGEY